MNKKFIIKNVSNFRDNYIADYINQYIKNDKFYNFGWGNLNEELIKFRAGKINFDKKIISQYGNSQGIDDLINEVIKFVHRKSDTKIEKENILITNGATNAIFY